MRSREEQLRRYTINIYLSITLTLCISFLLGIVILRSRQEVLIEEPRVPTFSYTNIEEIEDIKPTEKPAKPEYEIVLDDEVIDALSRMVYGETHGALSKTEMSACIWVVCNRADSWNMSLMEVLEQPGQFVGYKLSYPVTDEIRTLVIDVLTRWQIEQQGASEYEVCRTIPKNYYWWNGDAWCTHNIFRDAYDGYYNVWDWSLPNPYGD